MKKWVPISLTILLVIALGYMIYSSIAGDDSVSESGIFEDGDDYDVYEITGNEKIVFVYSNPTPENNNHL